MNEIERAVELLRAGELVAFPTETVYGLGADAANPDAVRRIFAAKGRPADHPLIVHIPGADHIERWACRIPDLAWELAEDFWPGPLTLILPRLPSVSDVITGGQETVGLRVPGHPLALDLLRAFDGGLAAPSANRFGRISPTTAAAVRDELDDRVALILDGGPCRVGIESTIIDLSSPLPRLLRPGHIRPDQIAAACGSEILASDASAPRVSGSLEAHYAPRTPLRLLSAAQLQGQIESAAISSLCVLARRPAPIAPSVRHWIVAPSNPVAFAHDLYASLRALDAAAGDLILVEAVPDEIAWHAVADRLRRSASGSGGD